MEDLGWKATGVGADQLLVVHSVGLCWICYSQLSSLLLELLPTAQSLCLSFTAQSSAHKSRFNLPCDGVFSRKSVFGKVSPQHSLFCWRKNNHQILPSEHVLSGRDGRIGSLRCAPPLPTRAIRERKSYIQFPTSCFKFQETISTFIKTLKIFKILQLSF